MCDRYYQKYNRYVYDVFLHLFSEKDHQYKIAKLYKNNILGFSKYKRFFDKIQSNRFFDQ
jgi:hypothetical protein